MKLHGRLAIVVVAVLAGAIGGIGATVAVKAGASSSENPVYYGCLKMKGGTLSKVGTTNPTCPTGSSIISWNQPPPQGPVCYEIPPAPAVANWSGCQMSLWNGNCQTPTFSIEGGNLSDADLSQTCFSEQLITSDSVTTSSGDDMVHVNLNGSDVGGSFFELVNLADASLINVDAMAADFTQANLTGADLSGANLTGATMTGANLTNVYWSNTTCPDGTNSDNDGGTCINNLTS